MKILVLNGPNLNLLGLREPDIYGREDYAALCRKIEEHAAERNVSVEIYQSNHEGCLVDKIQSAYGTADGIVFNPAAYTHTSVALLDALKAVGIPTVEVHISDVSKREDFRQTSYVRAACFKTISGKGFDGYLEAMDAVTEYVSREKAEKSEKKDERRRGEGEKEPEYEVIIKKGTAKGKISAPPSKSMAHRMLISAALSEESTVSGIALSDDIRATLGALRTLGATVERISDDGRRGMTYRLGGLIPENIPECTVYCGESGSTLRFMIPLCLLSENAVTLTGAKSLLSRPLGVYERLCRENGLYFSKTEGSLTVRGPLRSGSFKVSLNESSQFVTGLMFALSASGGGKIEIEGAPQSFSYITLTLQAMRTFGISAEIKDGAVYIPKDAKYRSVNAAVEGDCSNAAFLEALNVFGGDVKVEGISRDTLQGDRVYPEYFDRIKRGETCDLSDCPDLAPIMFGVAAYLGGGRFTGTRRLHMKESDRILAMKEELEKFGVSLCETLTATEDSVTVGGERLSRPTCALSGHRDHRIAMTVSLLCTLTGGVVSGAQAVAKSYPDFYEALEELGIELERRQG